MVDTGASISLIPRRLCEATRKAPKLSITGVTGGELKIVGTHSCVLDLGFKDDQPHTFLIAEVDLDYMILGTYFLSPRRLYTIPHHNLLVQESTGVSITMGRESHRGFNYQPLLKRPLVRTPRENIEPQPNREVVTGVNDTTRDSVVIKSAEQQCWEILREFPELTAEPNYSTPPKHSHVLDIELTSYEAVRNRPRFCSQDDQMAIDANFEDLLKKGAVEKGSSPFVSPICIARKKDGRPRICIDYTKLNQKTVVLNYPIPLIQSLPVRLTSDHQFFSVIDLRQAYYSLPLTPRASQLAGIITMNGCYRPLRCPFGLTNAPSKFCELVAELISGLEGNTFSYMDDFIIYSKSLGEHLRHLRALFERLKSYGMYLNEEKCVFARESVVFLGHEVSKNGLRPLQDKVEAVTKMQPPSTLTELRRFLGSINYYRSFLSEAAAVLAPLNKLLEGPRRAKNSKLEWGSEQQAAFEAAILLLKNSATLAHEDPTLPLVLSTDASLHHAGAVLEQHISTDNHALRPLAFYSRAFPKSVVARSVFNRELTALYQAVRHFKDRLRGRRVIVRTDHSSLIQAVSNGKGQHSPMEERMLHYIAEFCPKMIHVKGEDNQVADLLSRPLGQEDPVVESPLQPPREQCYNGPGVQTHPLNQPITSNHSPIIASSSNHNQSPKTSSSPPPSSSGQPSCGETLIPSEGERPSVNMLTSAPSPDPHASDSSLEPLQSGDLPKHLSLEVLAEQQRQEPGLIDEVNKSGELQATSTLEVVQREVIDRPDLELWGVITSGSDHFRPIVPRSLRALTYHLLHSTIHQGQDSSVMLIASYYYWPGMTAQIKEWVKTCPKCQSCKITRYNRQALQNYPNCSDRLHTVHVDMVGPLPESRGYRYILTMRDRSSGFVVAAPTIDKSSESVRSALLHHFIGKFGVPGTFVSDNGREFTSHLFSELCVRLGIHHQTTTSYHPQANGAIERIHRTLKTSFRALADPSHWVDHLPFTVLTINNVGCDNNPFTPHQHLFGQAGKLPGTFPFLGRIRAGRTPCISDTLAFFENVSQHQRSARPLHHSKGVYVEKGLFTAERVWVLNNFKHSSLDPLYTGPYLVVARKDKYFSILMDRGLVNVTVDRLKAAVDPSAFEAALDPVEVDYNGTNEPPGPSSGSDPELEEERPYNTRRDRRMPAYLRDYSLDID